MPLPTNPSSPAFGGTVVTIGPVTCTICHYLVRAPLPVVFALPVRLVVADYMVDPSLKKAGPGPEEPTLHYELGFHVRHPSMGECHYDLNVYDPVRGLHAYLVSAHFIRHAAREQQEAFIEGIFYHAALSNYKPLFLNRLAA